MKWEYGAPTQGEKHLIFFQKPKLSKIKRFGADVIYNMAKK